MADSAYYHLERMLPELDDLKERGLFSVSEIREIARQRREFEFRLERRSKVKDDYLKYIDYELKLEKLRRIRKKAIIRQLEASASLGSEKNTVMVGMKKKRWQPSLCDRTSAMRIMLIYERAVTRFKGDLGLWLQFIQYCRSQGTRRMQKVRDFVL
jgi:U3 small nucleolar RNA-associated protein 6